MRAVRTTHRLILWFELDDVAPMPSNPYGYGVVRMIKPTAARVEINREKTGELWHAVSLSGRRVLASGELGAQQDIAVAYDRNEWPAWLRTLVATVGQQYDSYSPPDVFIDHGDTLDG